MCEESRRADRHRQWLRMDVQDIRTQDGFSADSFALTNVRMVSISAKKTMNISITWIGENVRIFLYTFIQITNSIRVQNINRVNIQIYNIIGCNRIAIIKLLHQIAHALMIQMQFQRQRDNCSGYRQTRACAKKINNVPIVISNPITMNNPYNHLSLRLLFHDQTVQS